MVAADIITPKEFIGAVMDLCQDHRGQMGTMEYISADRVEMHYRMPLAEIVFDFFDQLKSRTKGYASLDYHEDGEQSADLVKVDILIQGEKVDAFSAIVHRDKAYSYGRDDDQEAARADPAPAVRDSDPGRDRLAHHRPGDQ